jgi:hypothetical protein
MHPSVERIPSLISGRADLNIVVQFAESHGPAVNSFRSQILRAHTVRNVCHSRRVTNRSGSSLLVTAVAVTTKVAVMTRPRIGGQRATAWLRRYLPCEIAGTTAEFGGAALAYAWTGSFVAAALAGTVAASAGYYASAYTSALRWSYSSRHGSHPTRMLMAALLALRSVAIEFGPAEAIDSIAVRPLAFYLAPQLLGGLAVGWITAKLFADIVFYALAIGSYERFGPLLARRPTTDEGEEAHEIDAAPRAA